MHEWMNEWTNEWIKGGRGLVSIEAKVQLLPPVTRDELNKLNYTNDRMTD